MKSTTAFRAIAARRASRTRETKRFLVKSVNKDGSLSRAAFSQVDWQYNAFETADAAEARRTELETLNPGRRFAVVPL